MASRSFGLTENPKLHECHEVITMRFLPHRTGFEGQRTSLALQFPFSTRSWKLHGVQNRRLVCYDLWHTADPGYRRPGCLRDKRVQCTSHGAYAPSAKERKIKMMRVCSETPPTRAFHGADTPLPAATSGLRRKADEATVSRDAPPDKADVTEHHSEA